MNSIEIYSFFVFAQNKKSVPFKGGFKCLYEYSLPTSNFQQQRRIFKVNLSFENVWTIHSVMFCKRYEWIRTEEPKATVAFLTLGTWFRDGLGSVRLTPGLSNLKGLSQPNDSNRIEKFIIPVSFSVIARKGQSDR